MVKVMNFSITQTKMVLMYVVLINVLDAINIK